MQVLKMFSSLHNEKVEDYNLSEREKRVLSLLINGYSYKMVSAEMFITIGTVCSHIKKVYEKLNVNSKSEAVAKAFKKKLCKTHFLIKKTKSIIDYLTTTLYPAVCGSFT